MKVEDFYAEAIRLAQKDYWTIFFNVIIYFLLIGFATITIIGLLATPALAVGLARFLLRAARGEEVDVGDSISWGFQDGMWLKSLVFFLIAGIGMFIGFLLLIIPGIYLSVAWILGVYLLVDKGLSPMDALSKSRDLVHEIGFWKVLVTIWAMTIGVQLISFIPILGFIALIFLYPFTMMVLVSIYQYAIKGETEVIDAKFEAD
tara:strand:+ start:444 stop:1055 length:612 start_codon:yes stop_codon:yes gene_type:complete